MSTAPVADLSFTLGVAVTVVLLALLVQRELVTACGQRFRSLNQYLALTIAPLLVIFAAIVVGRLTSAF
jgi:hypothetical protein